MSKIRIMHTFSRVTFKTSFIFKTFFLKHHKIANLIVKIKISRNLAPVAQKVTASAASVLTRTLSKITIL